MRLSLSIHVGLLLSAAVLVAAAWTVRETFDALKIVLASVVAYRRQDHAEAAERSPTVSTARSPSSTPTVSGRRCV